MAEFIPVRRAVLRWEDDRGLRSTSFSLFLCVATLSLSGCQGAARETAATPGSAPHADKGAVLDPVQDEPVGNTVVVDGTAPSDAATAPDSTGLVGPPPSDPVAVPPADLIAPNGAVMTPCGSAPQGMACIAPGPFIRGNEGGPSNEKPKAEVWISTFYMDLNEVTYGEYKACEKDKKCPRSGPQYIDFDRPLQPINGIKWTDAVAYCQAAGKRLPTEAEWEKAARGVDGRTYPWGEELATCERAIIYGRKEGRGCGLKKAGKSPDTGRPWEVGSKAATQYGLFDMAGNSWEWVSDWYTRSYEDCGADCAGVDPKGPCGGAESCPGRVHKIVRGGSWYWPAEYATTTHRRPHVPSNEPFHHFGFRCAASEDQATSLRTGGAPGNP